MATSYVPMSLHGLREYLKPRTGLDNFSLGIVNNETDASYHHGWSQRKQSGDYSWNESSRDSNHKTNAARAVDIGMFPRLREMSVWLVGECQRGAPDCADIREIIYSPDGVTVKRWDRLEKRSTGDKSHLTHTHVSWFADAEDRAKVGPFIRFFEGQDVSDIYSQKGQSGDSVALAQFMLNHVDSTVRVDGAYSDNLKQALLSAGITRTAGNSIAAQEFFQILTRLISHMVGGAIAGALSAEKLTAAVEVVVRSVVAEALADADIGPHVHPHVHTFDPVAGQSGPAQY